jgi:hypothetical protein
MSDERLREAERRWHETGAADDEGAWLRERVRAGLFPPERLSLAAYAGHPGAKAAAHSGDHEPSQAARRLSPGAPSDLGAFVRGLIDWGGEAVLRAIATLEARDLVREGLTDPRAGRVVAFLDGCRVILGEARRGKRPPLAYTFLDVVLRCTRPGAPAREVFTAGAHAVRLLVREDEAGARRDLERDLTAWALGPEDPLRVRVHGGIWPRIAEPRPYDPTVAYARGDRVVHPRFGVGDVVTASAGGVEVVFAGGVRRRLRRR